MMTSSAFDTMLLPLHVIDNVSMIRIINTPLKMEKKIRIKLYENV